MKKQFKLFISGTGTDVGKTFITENLIYLLKSKGLTVSPYKPIETGCKKSKDKLIPSDANKFYKLINKISEAKSVADEIQTSILNKKFKKSKYAPLKQKLDMLVSKEGTYMQPMLIDQMKYLYGMISKADQILGNDAYKRFNDLSLELENIKKL